mmetsp:Transcript_118630/g.242463  ORF Transcript_118630/g.242463 Transcript_118630/m.242463 type:complete len:295 (+) Transcript_118630:54-938(+)
MEQAALDDFGNLVHCQLPAVVVVSVLVFLLAFLLRPIDGNRPLHPVRVLVHPVLDLTLVVRVRDVIMSVASILELLLPIIPILLGFFHDPVGRVQMVDKDVLVHGVLVAKKSGSWEERAEDHARRHLIPHVSQVHRLVWLRFALKMYRHGLDQTIFKSIVHFLRVVVEVVPLLHKAVASNAKGESREVGGMHPCGIGLDNAPPVPVDHIANPGSAFMHLVHPDIGNETQGLADTGDLLELVATIQVNCVVGQPFHSIYHVMKLAVGVADEGHVANAKSAVLRNGHIVTLFVGEH